MSVFERNFSEREGRAIPARSFTILFEGLICHLGPDSDKKDRAVLLDDKPAHRPFLKIINRLDLINQNDPDEIPLDKRDDVSFEVLPGGFGRPQPDFKKFVRRLRGLLEDGDLARSSRIISKRANNRRIDERSGGWSRITQSALIRVGRETL